MPIQSPLSHITEVIQQVKSSAQNYKTVLQNNEAATRATLIDPILRALGWDTADARMVVFELTSGGFRVDYALRDAQSHVKAIVEAKAFGGNLDDTSIIGKLFNYAIHFKLSEIWLTDGVVWHHHANLNIKDYAPTRILDLAHDDPAVIAAYFVASLDAAKYWPKEVTIDNVTREVEKLRQQICEMQKDYFTLEQRLKIQEEKTQQSVASSSNPEQLARSASNPPTHIPAGFTDLSTFFYRGGTKPKRLQLPDDSQVDVASWNQVLAKCCEYVLSMSPNLTLPIPDIAGRKVNLLSLTPPPLGRTHSTYQYQSHTVYIWLHYSAADCVRNAIHVLSLLEPTLHSNASIECQ